MIASDLRLERQVAPLQAGNGECGQRSVIHQKQVGQQAGQRNALLDLVSKALDEREEARAEEAAVRAFERMTSMAAPGPGGKPQRKVAK